MGEEIARNVVSLAGAEVHHPGNPDPELIERIEWLLERVKAGEINGVAAAFAYLDGSASYFTEVGTGCSTPAMLGVMKVAADNLSDVIRGK